MSVAVDIVMWLQVHCWEELMALAKVNWNVPKIGFDEF